MQSPQKPKWRPRKQRVLNQYEVDNSNCNYNVDMVYVADQDEWEVLATNSGHLFRNDAILNAVDGLYSHK